VHGSSPTAASQRGREVARDQAAALDKAAAASGVPTSILLGIVGVETFYGEITGRFRVIDALSTLAFDYEPRAKYFRGELEQYLLMTREEELDPLDPLGSYAGAMGIPQFMPTSFRAYAVDGGGDGHRDLWGDWSDVFASVGNYLKVHGWHSGEPVMVAVDVTGADLNGLETQKLDLSTTVGALRARGIKFDCGLPDDAAAVLIELEGATGPEYRVGFANFYAITRYNRSALYASAVNDLAEAVQAPVAATSPSPATTDATTSRQPAAGQCPAAARARARTRAPVRRFSNSNTRHPEHTMTDHAVRFHRRLALFAALAGSLSLSLVGCSKSSDETTAAPPAATADQATTPAPATPLPAPPQLKVRSFIVLDHNSGRVLAAMDPDSRQEPASLTKLMTAYVVFHTLKQGRIKLDDLVTVSENAWRQASPKLGGSAMYIEVGKQVSVENLLQGMIVQSGNDATVALAEHVAGTEPRSCR
jgi:lytic murein transglycosylase B